MERGGSKFKFNGGSSGRSSQTVEFHPWPSVLNPSLKPRDNTDHLIIDHWDDIICQLQVQTTCCFIVSRLFADNNRIVRRMDYGLKTITTITLPCLEKLKKKKKLLLIKHQNAATGDQSLRFPFLPYPFIRSPWKTETLAQAPDQPQRKNTTFHEW